MTQKQTTIAELYLSFEHPNLDRYKTIPEKITCTGK